MTKEGDFSHLDNYFVLSEFRPPDNEKIENIKWINTKIQCSYEDCKEVFASKEHLRDHYKQAHPDAVFEVDFPDDTQIST
jgi:hypothetical protein